MERQACSIHRLRQWQRRLSRRTLDDGRDDDRKTKCLRSRINRQLRTRCTSPRHLRPISQTPDPPLHHNPYPFLADREGAFRVPYPDQYPPPQCNVDYSDYGTEFMTSRKYNPNACVNMILQLAFYWLYGKAIPTSEYVSTGNFYCGRLEIARVVSDEAVAFCSAMTPTSGGTSGDVNANGTNGTNEKRHINPDYRSECLELFNKAVRRHLSRVSAASCGEGIDAHLFALLKMVRTNEGENMPAMFLDEAYEATYLPSVSTMSMAPSVDGGGYFPDNVDGWSVSFLLKESRLVSAVIIDDFSPFSFSFNGLIRVLLFSFRLLVISRHPRHEELCEKLQQAAAAIKALFS